jgi:hypothetical protein
VKPLGFGVGSATVFDLLMNAVCVMLKRSDFWRQAQVCMSLARVTSDPALKELYEEMAVNFAHNAARERDDLDGVKRSAPESGDTSSRN